MFTKLLVRNIQKHHRRRMRYNFRSSHRKVKGFPSSYVLVRGKLFQHNLCFGLRERKIDTSSASYAGNVEPSKRKMIIEDEISFFDDSFLFMLEQRLGDLLKTSMIIQTRINYFRIFIRKVLWGKHNLFKLMQLRLIIQSKIGQICFHFKAINRKKLSGRFIYFIVIKK